MEQIIKGMYIGVKFSVVRDTQNMNDPFVQPVLAEVRKALEAIPGTKIVTLDADVDSDEELLKFYGLK